MKTRRSGYHHGDLRRALMQEALKLMAKTSPDALSLRELARRLGVTYGAPHHHFAEKDDLFAAIAEEAFAELAASIQSGVSSKDMAPGERLYAIARGYLAFAMNERVRYRIMFLPQLRDRKRFASLHATGGRALQLLAAAFELAGTPAEASHARAISCWSALHGFAVLTNEGFLEERGAALASLTDQVARTATRG